MVTAYARPKNGKLPPEVDLGRLCDAVARDRRELQPFRTKRRTMVRQYLGAWYGDNAAGAPVPVNLLGLYVQVITQALVSDTVKVMLSTFDRGQTATVDAQEQWTNDELDRMNVVETYKRIAHDALFWVGIAKVALATPVDAAAEAWDVEAGQPFIEHIDPDDAVWDTTARRYSRCAYVGYRYRLPVALANELYAKGRAEKFEAGDREDINDGGDERIHTLSATTGRREQLEDECDLWELYLARHKLIVTLRDSGGRPDAAREPVRVQRWVGPSCGPFHFFGVGIAPGNLEPKAPIMDLVDTHLAHANAYRKLLERTKNAKKVTIYEDADDAKKFQDAPDGGMINVRHAAGFQTIESGGPTQDLLTMTDHIKAMFELVGDNLSVLGGRSTEARTLGQEKMLNENAGAGIAALSSAYLGFLQGTVEALHWYCHYHPTKVMESRYAPPSLPGLAAVRRVTPAMRRAGPMPHVKIDLYSQQRQTPQSRIAYIDQTMTQMQPYASLMAQQGKLPDLDAYLALKAKYGNEPDLTRIFGLTVPPTPGDGGSAGGGGGMPANTTRTIERHSSGGQGPQAEKQDLALNVSRMDGPANPNGGGGQ